MKFLITGLGSIGRRHLRNLISLGEKDLILYRTNKSTLPDEELSNFPVETELDKALAHKPDAVIIANPTALHLDVAIPAALAGCHLLIEKPISDKYDQRVTELQKIIKDNNTHVLIGFQFRFHPTLNKVHEILSSGKLGRPLAFRSHWGEYLPDWHPWEDYKSSYAARKDLGGGVVNTLSHPLDYARWLFGDVGSLSAFTGNISDLDLEVEDAAEITMHFKSGCIGSIHLDYFQRPPAHWLEITCDSGLIKWDNATGFTSVYKANNGTPELITLPEAFSRNNLFIDEIKHFLELIKGIAVSRCTLDDGIKALELTEAVHISNFQKSSKVTF